MRVMNFKDHYWTVIFAMAWMARRNRLDVEYVADYMPSTDEVGLDVYLASLEQSTVCDATDYSCTYDIRSEFWREVQSGSIPLTGVRIGDADRQEIPTLTLADMILIFKNYQYEVCANDIGGRIGWDNLLCKSDDVKEVWPKQSRPFSSGPRKTEDISKEQQAGKFFVGLGPWENGVPRKQDAFKLAKEEFPSLSNRAMERAWANGAHFTRKSPGTRGHLE